MYRILREEFEGRRAALHRFWGGNVFILAAAVEAIKRITWTDEAIMKPSQGGKREGGEKEGVWSVSPSSAGAKSILARSVPFNPPQEDQGQDA